jgi:hypothetical protein
MRKRLARSKET